MKGLMDDFDFGVFVFFSLLSECMLIAFFSRLMH